MQIIIVQSEIETAIRNHILSLIDIKEGARIDIDLSATRGADGFKATIDIVSGDAQPTQAQPAPVEEPQTTQAAEVNKTPEKGLKIAETVRRARKPAAPVQEATAPAEEPVETDPPFETDSPAAETVIENDPELDAAHVEEEAPPSDTDQPEPATQPAPARSLFANLGKPVNE